VIHHNLGKRQYCFRAIVLRVLHRDLKLSIPFTKFLIAFVWLEQVIVLILLGLHAGLLKPDEL